MRLTDKSFKAPSVNSETSVVATRIADCVVLAIPDDLSADRLQQLEAVARQCVIDSGLRAMVFDASALKYADLAEFRELMALADTVALLSVEPILVGLNPGIIMHWVRAGADLGRVRGFLDLADALTALGLTVDKA